MKRILYNLLCNRVAGTLLLSLYKNHLPDLRWKNFSFQVDPRYVNKSIIASIFWGFYEGAEIRFIEKYLRSNEDVIELGGSIGVVSSHILNKLDAGRKFVTVEANPSLLDTINENLERHNRQNSSFNILNKAISYNGQAIYINVTDNNTESWISTEKREDKSSIPIGVITLSEIIRDHAMNEFVLVSDIEGSEIEFLMLDEQALQKCRRIFIELHDTNYKGRHYPVNALIKLIETRHGFKLKDRHGPVCYFERES